MNCPPSKRLRGSAPVLDLDPFDEDFTQDDLNEIDIIASQAITTTTGTSGAGLRAITTATGAGSGVNFNVGRQNVNNSNSGSRAALGSDRLLEAQLKRKLQEVEEDILLKSGEIRVLRDSLRAAQQEAEAQRLRQVQLQTQQHQEQSNREKELLKKVQSLESQLQFKEAEMNDMRSKLLSDRRSSPLCRSSPKPQSSASPSAGGFITKESFSAQVCSGRTTPGPGPGPGPANKTTPGPGPGPGPGPANRTTPGPGPGPGPASRTPVKTPSKSRRQEVTRTDPFLSVRPPRTSHSGGVLLGLLLQPLSPRISLCHLLSLSPTSSSLVGSSSDVISSTGSPLSPVQSLALTGLNTLSLHRSPSSCPGAALLLPLLRSHLSQLCSSLDSNGGVPACTGATTAGGPGPVPACTGATTAGGPGPVPACTGAGAEAEVLQSRSGLTAEECGLVALRTLTTLLTHSQEVVEAVLTQETRTRTTELKAVDSVSQNALLPCVLRLCQAAQRPEVACSALTALRVLVERTPETQEDRLGCVLSELCVCVSADQRLKVVSQCVSVLTSITDHCGLTQQLCSQHDPCVVLRLLQFIRTRSDPEAAHSDWVQLDLKVVRFLTRILSQSSLRATNIHCTCSRELVQCVVLVLHRLWLDIRSSQAPPTPQAPPPQSCGRGLASLRETVLLLHWLLQNHSGFTESCRGVLHLYDQVVPGLRDSLRTETRTRTRTRTSYSEELALDEICRSEADDDMDTDSGS